MKVRELIEKLKGMDQDLDVIVWRPGIQLEPLRVSEVFDHPRKRWAAMIESEIVSERTLTKRGDAHTPEASPLPQPR